MHDCSEYWLGLAASPPPRRIPEQHALVMRIQTDAASRRLNCITGVACRLVQLVANFTFVHVDLREFMKRPLGRAIVLGRNKKRKEIKTMKLDVSKVTKSTKRSDGSVKIYGHSTDGKLLTVVMVPGGKTGYDIAEIKVAGKITLCK